MFFAKFELEQLLKKLRENETESSCFDVKEDLPLTSEGDKARFIRHIVALANTGKPSYLFVGVEDKTWAIAGIPEDSSLLEADVVQQSMNHILMGRVDPSLVVRYRTYKLSAGVIGVVAVRGVARPYVVAIADAEYGGDRDRGAPEYIRRGAIYVRQGANSIIANRQSQIVSLVNANPPSFLLGSIYVVEAGVILNALLGLESSFFGHEVQPLVGAIIGILTGFTVAVIFTKNLAETMGDLLKEATVKKYTRVVWGVLFCVLNGAYVGYKLTEAVHQGELPFLSSPFLSLVIMGGVGMVLIGPLAAVYTTFLLNIVGLVFDFLIKKLRFGWGTRLTSE